jgi:hypothetical protein
MSKNILLTSVTRDTTEHPNPADFGGDMPITGTSYNDSGSQKYMMEMNWITVPTSAIANIPYIMVKLTLGDINFRGYISNDPKVMQMTFIVPVHERDTTTTTLTLANRVCNFAPLNKTFHVTLYDPSFQVITIADPTPITLSQQVAIHLTATLCKP